MSDGAQSELDLRDQLLGGAEKGAVKGGWVTGALNAVDANEELAKQRSLVEQQQEQIDLDPLTKVKSRAYLEKQLRLIEAGNQMYWLGFVDADHFKNFNDTYGHDVGDEVLRILGARLLGGTKASDLVARWGGEEFLVLMPNVGQSVESVTKRFEELREKIAKEPFRIEQDGKSLELPVSVSLGVARRKSGETTDDFVIRADRAMYRAKMAGRNCVRVYETMNDA